MQKQDCFFLLDSQVELSDRKLQIMCCECALKNKPDNGWFWEGSKRGYGPYLFQCDFCGLIISKPEEK